ncbi:HAUS augmin-like complex subunit 6 [Atheta coriaria]|uniref:HAUS augmin-like complex subunit 6 n=1 Tax=Dalotia coriaria TaxID=877792 RepID=UPI0031F3AE97
MSAIQEQKSIDQRTHMQLFNYMVLLKHLYPTTEAFDSVCKPDMFVKNNKAAFQHVIYYLFKILNPAIIKKKISNWPILDIKMEAQFRKEVMTYINELKTIYPNYEIPTIVASQLINPGGLKFVNLMLDITQLVVTEAIKREDCINFPLLPTVNCSSESKEHIGDVITHVNKLLYVTEQETLQKVMEHNQKMLEYEKQAKLITQKIVESKKNIVQMQMTLEHLQSEAKSADINDDDLDAIETDSAEVLQIHEKFKHCNTLFNYFKNNECFLESDKPISLLKHFEKFNKFCAASIYDVRRIDRSMVDNKMEIIRRLLKQYDALLQNCPLLEERQQLFLQDLKRNCQNTEDFSKTMQDNQITPQNTPNTNQFFPKIIINT